MPKQRRRSLREAVCSRSSPVCDGSGRGGGRGGGGRAGNFSSTQICDDQAQMAEQYSGQAGVLSDSHPGRGCTVPQVTITSDGDSREITEEDLEEEVNGRLRRKLSNSSISSNGSSTAFDESEDDLLSDNETKSKGIVTLEHLGDSVDSAEQTNAWWKLKTIVKCPLVASQRRRLSWVQLAGHKGSFKAGDEGSILKKFSENENRCFERLKEDALHGFVPGYYGLVKRDGELFLKMTDLLASFDTPNVMDCKMGVRTYLEDELVRARVKPKLREDLYNKMLEVDSGAPTAEERQQKAVTKPRLTGVDLVAQFEQEYGICRSREVYKIRKSCSGNEDSIVFTGVSDTKFSPNAPRSLILKGASTNTYTHLFDMKRNMEKAGKKKETNHPRPIHHVRKSSKLM